MTLRAMLISLALGVLVATGSPVALAQAGRGDDPITLNFKDADIDSVVGAFGHLLGRTFVIDPRVRGKLTLETPRPVTRAQAYDLLQSSLRLQGFAVVDSGGLVRVVPEADAKLQPGPVGAGPTGRGEGVVTQIFRLNYESATNLVNVLRPLISPNNTISAYPNNNSLVVTDYAANVQRLARIIASLDAPSTNEVEVVPVRNGLAADLAVTMTRLLDGGGAGAPGGGGVPGAAVDPGQRVSVLADPRTNSVLIRSGSPARLNLAKSLLARLDQPTSQPGNINVVYLRNAEAVRLAQVLRGVLAGEGGSGSTNVAGALSAATPGGFGAATPGFGTQAGSAGGTGGLGASSASATPLQGSSGTATGPTTFTAGGAVVAADPSTNSLIITAPESVYRNLRAVIDKLDARRAQVYIESLIVEVTAERAAEFGLQFQFLTGLAGSGTSGFGGTNLPTNQGANILGVSQNPAGVGQGLNVGIVRGRLSIPGTNTEILNIPLLARALETDARANILATPNLLTLDNEEARIIIGQNVPFITGSFTSGTVGAANPFQTIERRDVGTTLRVRPQVSEGGTVTLRIFQEVSSVQDRTLQQGLITNRRAIESNVLVDDGQIIVLGGLIEERVEGGVNKVPGLGDIPIVGQLFRYDTRRRVKTNLLVFLRPVVLRSADATHAVTSDRYDYIRQLQGDSRLPRHWALPEFPPSTVPAMPPRPGDPRVPPVGPDGRRPGPASLSSDIDVSSRVNAPIRESLPAPMPMLPEPAPPTTPEPGMRTPGAPPDARGAVGQDPTVVDARPSALRDARPGAAFGDGPRQVGPGAVQTAPNEVYIGRPTVRDGAPAGAGAAEAGNGGPGFVVSPAGGAAAGGAPAAGGGSPN
jgi:general secretion pathway protein D